MKCESERLFIRQYNAGDAKDAGDFLRDNKTMYYIPEKFESEQSVIDFIVKEHDRLNYFPVILKKEKKVIGHIYFSPFFGEHSYEIGWVFHSHYQRQGYAKEAASTLLDYFFNERNIHRVIATCQPENISSWSLMEALGMRREGFFKSCIPVGNEWWDEYYYAILRDEWLNKSRII